jgi:hypothetical protein
MNRRDFLSGSSGAALFTTLPGELLAQAANPPASSTWNAGALSHLLPTVSDSAILIKASFAEPLAAAPLLRVGATDITGRMTDTAGQFWQFLATGLPPGKKHTLSLVGAGGRALCEPWELSTFPAPDSQPERFRVVFYTCAGGHAGLRTRIGTFLPTEIRNRLLRRGLSFQPDAMVANGDHVYWDLLAPRASPVLGASPEAIKLAGTFDRSAMALGGKNEAVLKLAAGPQIVPVYGTDFRSTPMFFLQDDHDYFDNDEATDDIVTFPPTWFMLQLARASQSLYYPEFLPDPARPLGLPGSASGDRQGQVSESFGTIRCGRLAEVVLYDVRRTMTLAGPSAVYVDREVEAWLQARTRATDVTHLVHAPSNPPGWSAGKWGEWYPDVVDDSGKLSVAKPKPYWQPGWLAQHDRLMAAFAETRSRIPLVISGDLHDIGIGRITRSGKIDLTANPVNAVLAGPIGTSPGGWPSAFRGVGAMPPVHLDMEEEVKPIEQHGFTVVDFERDRIVLRFFKWDLKTQKPEAIDTLEPFHATTLTRPA